MSYHRVTISGFYVQLGVTTNTVLHIENIDGLRTHEEIAADFFSDWVQTQKALCTNIFRFDTIQVRNMSLPNEVPYTHVITPLTVGGSSNNHLSPVLTWVVRLRTNLIGRHGRGRIYMPGIHDGNMVRHQVSNGGLQAFASQKPAFMRYVSGAPGNNKGFYLVIWPKTASVNQ